MTESEMQEAVILITSMRKCVIKPVKTIDPEAMKRINEKKYRLQLKIIEQEHR